MLSRAVLHGRRRDYEPALGVLDEIAAQRQDGALGPNEMLEKGRLLDQMGRYDDAFVAFVDGKRLVREVSGTRYMADHAAQTGGAPEGLLHRQPHEDHAPREPCARTSPQPMFIIGFPRSGTTLIEQTLGAHPADLRRRRTAVHRRHHRADAADAGQPADLSRRPVRAVDGRPARGAGQSARLLSAARPPAGRHRAGRALVHRQDAAERDASGPDRAAVPGLADHPRDPPSARRGAVGVLQPADPRLLLRL